MSVGGTIDGSKWGPSKAPIWIITAHALRRYVERVHHDVSFRRAAEELQQQLGKAHFVKLLPSGLEYWRGPAPRRIRIRARRLPQGLEVATIIAAFDGLGR